MATVKEKIVRKSIKTVENRIAKIEAIIFATPGSDLINVRQQAQKLLEDNKGIEKRTSKEFIEKIEELSKQEKDCWKMINKQKNYLKYADKQSELQSELSELKRELYYIENTRR